ncbi:MAG: nucleotidyl transferase AbiEii/AbiGii toxin family protein [Candidatus Micrarchaeota archaeon]
MDVTDLNRQAAIEGIPQAVIEKDYALSVVLTQLSKSRLKEKIVFKGGTAVKKAFFAKARFSEDLDFSVSKAEPKEIVDELKNILEDKEIAGIRFERLEQEKTSAGLRLALKFTGFLRHPQRIRFDFSFRTNTVLPPEERELNDDYSLEKTRALVLVMPLEELLAEKIHAAFNRIAARDLYDVWFLLRNGVKANQSVIRKKFAYYDEEYEPEKLKERIGGFKLKWMQDLQQFLKDVPSFELVAKETAELLKLENA